jgi:hypothetical protein
LIKVPNWITDMKVLMYAYGQTSDANAGILRESWGNGSRTSRMTSNSPKEYGSQNTSQQTTELVPVMCGEIYSTVEPADAIVG